MPAVTNQSELGGHARLDARSLALGELTAKRLRERPELLEAGRRNLARWRNLCAPAVQETLREWEGILAAGLEETTLVLTGGEERHVRLRQSSPFAGEEVVSREERRALWERFKP